jgi:dienelactone hydrolase
MRLTALAALIALAATACKKNEDKKPEPKQTAADAAASKPATAPDAAAAADVKTEEVTYSSNGTELKGYLALPAKTDKPVPGVLVVHEWWGHNDYVRERAEMLAKLGYAAFALDMYGGGKSTEHPDDAQKFMKEAMANMDEAVKRFEAAKKLLEEHAATNAEEIAAIGYCFGGGVVLNMARRGMDLDAVAAFHAGSLTSDKPLKKGEFEGVVMVAHGAADPFVAEGSVDKLKKEMTDAGVDLRFFSYEGAKHAFTNPAADTKKMDALAYDKEADEKSWAELEKLLAEVFKD